MSEVDNAHRAVGPGMYEVWFLTLTDRSSGVGYWIRSTYHSPPRGRGTAGVWFARFDPADPETTFGIHRTSSDWSLDPGVFDVRVAGTVMSSGRAEGSVQGGGHEARWNLFWPTGPPTHRLLPSFMYRGAIAPTKPFSPNVDTRFYGSISVDGRTGDVADAPGQQGHLFGTRHAERWAWAHCGDFLDEDSVVHALTAQGRRGPIRTPFLTSIGIRWGDRWIRLVKVSPRREFSLGMWRVDLENRRYRLTGRIEAPSVSMLRARYEDPDGRPRFCHNSEIASCRLALFERRRGGFEEVALLESRGTTHAEWAGTTPASAVTREFAEVGA
ncbi:MAG: hypothetical protein E6G40_08825 [Actinobacteria bacterium]|nr:MAG: hypothetical protein E6G40_08825 [Actinomycetota bacterium]